MPPRFGVILAGLALGLAPAIVCAATLQIGIDLDGEPLTYVDGKGVPRGFAVDIVNTIAAEMDFDVVYVARPWPEMFDDFTAGRTDALANITYTKERATIMDFSVPHIVMAGALFVRTGSPPISSLTELRDHHVAVKPGGAPHAYLVAHGWAEHVVPSTTLRDSLRAVAEGRADAALDSRIVGLKIIRDERLHSLTTANIELFDFAQRLHIGLHTGDVERQALFNEGLARLHANGTYDRIYERWIDPLDPRALRIEQLKPYLWPAIVVLIVVVGAFVWQRHLLARLARQAEALRLGEERLTLVLEGSEDGFWDWDMRDGRVERSERWAAMLGFTLAEIPPTREAGLDLVHPDDRHLWDVFTAPRAAHATSRHSLEYRMRTKSGEWRWILDRSKVVARAPDGAPWRIAGTHTDITDLKQAQGELSRQEARFRFIYERAPVGLSWLHRGEEETRLVNAAHVRITGVPAAQAQDSSRYVTASHPDDRRPQAALQEQLNRGEIDHFALEKRYVHPGGAVVWAMLSMHLYRDPVSGETQEVATLVDITDLRQAEEERENLRRKMLETQKLESLGVLAGGIAHDFNNLLTVILANASLTRSVAATEAERDENLTLIEDAARRAADLCRQMLAYAGRGRFVIERVDVGVLVQDTIKLLKISLTKHAQFEITLAPHLPSVEGDISQLQQVLMNLVINAAEALGDAVGAIRLTTGPGGEIALPAPGRVVHSFLSSPRKCVCLEVADTGGGMDDGTLARIFDPFFSTKFTGRGLGLAAVLGIVRSHQGALVVESTPGRGTTFRLHLPVAKPGTVSTPSATGAGRAPQGRSPKGTLLVADDEPAVLSTTGGLLRRAGYGTVLAADGYDALAHFRSNPTGFAGVLLDLTMPGLDGAQVLREIRALDPAARVPVMSGFSEQDVLTQLDGLGPVVILHKPFTLDALVARVTEMLGD